MELERLALERASPAREAIRIMGEFAERYGYGDSGECLTVGDAAEVWQFEIFGPGAADIGAVWAAKRIPPGEVGVSANVSRITTLGDDPNFTMHSKNVYEVAEKNGWWKKGEPFVFNRAYGMSGSPRFNRREWRVLSLLAPSLKLDPWAPEQPFSVKPDRKVTKQTHRHPPTFTRTPFDQTTNPLAGRSARPTAGPSRATAGRSYMPTERMIAVQCSHVVVLQAGPECRPDWQSRVVRPDDAKTSAPRRSCRQPQGAPAFEIGRRDRFDRGSAWWASNFIATEPELARHQDVRAGQAEGRQEVCRQPVIEAVALEQPRPPGRGRSS